MTRLTIVLSLAFIAIGGSTARAADVDRCGTITAGDIGDLPSGGYISIEGDKYLVGGVDPTRTVTLPPAALVTPGARVCFRGTVVESAPRVFDVRSGSFTMQSATLPATATEGSSGGMLIVGLALIVGGGVLLRRRPIDARHRS